MMANCVCTTITSGGSNPAETTITYETTVAYSTASSNFQIAASEFKILSETAPRIFKVSGDRLATEVVLDKLEVSLAGTMLLVEYDGQYKRLWTWLWKYSLNRDVCNTLRLTGDWPEPLGLGRGYVLTGGSSEILVNDRVLEGKWSGRLLIQEYKNRTIVLLEYFWQDIKKTILGILIWGRRQGQSFGAFALRILGYTIRVSREQRTGPN
ncbi:hypothetical protein B0J14DRAFT_183988 [Halenospora varia]|nr:hypothetical protein B0J14DRAFT_183988 [Halenospora varia]